MLVHPEADPLFACGNAAMDAIVSAVDATASCRLERRSHQFVMPPGFAA